MKKVIFLGLAALGLTLAPGQSARANGNCQFSFGVGMNFGFQWSHTPCPPHYCPEPWMDNYPLQFPQYPVISGPHSPYASIPNPYQTHMAQNAPGVGNIPTSYGQQNPYQPVSYFPNAGTSMQPTYPSYYGNSQPSYWYGR